MGGNGKETRQSKNRKRLCPTCGTTFIYDDSDAEMKRSFPFCSARCKMADLDRWFSGDYRISRGIRPDDLEEEEIASEE